MTLSRRAAAALGAVGISALALTACTGDPSRFSERGGTHLTRIEVVRVVPARQRAFVTFATVIHS